ncbi:AlpA family transcriptional regulator [uncultured Salinisphaera sp.]|uniref:helix-turn-helix transcriptional regulator n=1 Tax=uncultured Salinisphaera sp. TaxID=359372 RepID=UPI0032B24994
MAKQSLIRLPAVKARTGQSRSAIYAAMQRGEFPQSVPIGPRAVAWVESEIDAYIERQIEQRSEAA